MVMTEMERSVKLTRRTAGGISAAAASKIQVIPYERKTYQ